MLAARPNNILHNNAIFIPKQWKVIMRFCKKWPHTVRVLQLSTKVLILWKARLLTVQEVSRSNTGTLFLLDACREFDWLLYWPPRGQQVLHQKWIWVLHCVQARNQASEGSILALKPRVDVTRSLKQGCQWPHKKDWSPSKKNFRKKNYSHLHMVSSVDSHGWWNRMTTANCSS